MSCLLVVQPDSVQADDLLGALRPCISEDVVVAESLEDALSSIDQDLPDVILLPTLIPAATEDYLITYLAAIPGARHVQILGLPRLERSDNSVKRRARWLFRWQRQPTRAIGTRGCDPAIFTQDVVTYLAGARTLKEEIQLYSAHAAVSGRPERRSEPRFANCDVPWISLVRFGAGRAALINVSSRGALLRTHTRPQHYFLRRADSHVREQPRLTLEVGPHREVDLIGRVIRCVPLKTNAETLYEVAFSFDDSVRLHLPATGALIPVESGPETAPAKP
jgi:hypothetical protein